MAVIVNGSYVLENFNLVPEELLPCTEVIMNKIMTDSNNLVRLSECCSGVKITCMDETGQVKIGRLKDYGTEKEWKEIIMKKGTTCILTPGNHLIVNNAHFLLKEN